MDDEEKKLSVLENLFDGNTQVVSDLLEEGGDFLNIFQQIFNRIINNFKSWFYALLPINTKTYEKLLLDTKYPVDCIALYMHLLWTARRQKTNSVKAQDVYLRGKNKGLHLPEKRLKRAKAELRRVGFIETIARRKPDGTFDGWYIKIKTLPSVKLIIKEFSSSGSITTRVDNHPCGYDEQMLVLDKQMLKENNKQPDDVVSRDFRHSENTPFAVQWEEKYHPEKIPANIQNQYQDIVDKCIYNMLQKVEKSDIKKSAVGYLKYLCEHPDSVPEIPREGFLTGKDKDRVRRLLAMMQENKEFPVITEAIQNMISQIEKGVSEERHQELAKELNQTLQKERQIYLNDYDELLKDKPIKVIQELSNSMDMNSSFGEELRNEH